MGSCWICEENDRQAVGRCDGAVAELETGWVRLHRRQRYRGGAFFVSRTCVREVYDLDAASRSLHLVEMAEVAAAIDATFSPVKMNIEALGNGIPHLHWWLTPRHEDDPRLSAPIWENPEFLRDMSSESGFADPDALAHDADLLRAELTRRGLIS